MPQRDLPAYVHDVVMACRRVVEYADGLTADDFIADNRSRDAIERQLLIIGGAVNHIRRLSRETAELLGPIDRIIAFRSILVHGYHLIEPRTVWQIVEEHVPALMTEAQRLLDQMPPPDEVPLD